MKLARCPKCNQPTLVYSRETILEAPIYEAEDLFYVESQLEEDLTKRQEIVYCESCDYWMDMTDQIESRPSPDNR